MASSIDALSIRFLGTDSCTPTKGNNTASMVVDDRILIDTGWYLTDRLLACNIDPLAIEAVLFTHCHHDHIMGLPQLVFYYGIRRNARPERPLHIFGPAGEVGRVVADAQRYLQHDRYPELVFDIEVHDVAAGDAFALGDLRVTTCAARHNAPGLNYRIDSAAGASVAFSGDTAFNPDLIELAQGADLLVHEASHGPNSSRDNADAAHSGAPDAAQVARQASVARLALVHCSESNRDAALDAARAVFPTSFFPSDGEPVTVVAPQPRAALHGAAGCLIGAVEHALDDLLLIASDQPNEVLPKEAQIRSAMYAHFRRQRCIVHAEAAYPEANEACDLWVKCPTGEELWIELKRAWSVQGWNKKPHEQLASWQSDIDKLPAGPASAAKVFALFAVLDHEPASSTDPVVVRIAELHPDRLIYQARVRDFHWRGSPIAKLQAWVWSF